MQPIAPATGAPLLPTTGLLAEARQIADWIVGLRRELHRFPELMYEEVRTSASVCRTLDELEIPYTSGIARTGVVAIVGSGAEPCVALRADMDALPIKEEADVEFRSEIDGRMHACGHDCHTAMLLGAARLLKSREKSLRGTVKLIFQPAEEGGAGGQAMCDAGVLEHPRVDRIFGIHVWPFSPVGTIGGCAGTFLAAVGKIDIRVVGIGGHAGLPHLTRDPVVTAAKIIVELQTIVSREIDPSAPAVLTLGSIHGGDAFNVIPGDVQITGTIRSLTTEGLRFLQQRIREVCIAVAKANRCEAVVDFPDNDYPATVNDAGCWADVKSIAAGLLDERAVLELKPVMGGEDFAYYGAHARACFVALGTRNDAIDAGYAVHHPKFKVDEAALPIGSALHVAYAIHALTAAESVGDGTSNG